MKLRGVKQDRYRKWMRQRWKIRSQQSAAKRKESRK
jgi:hypothetical protein